MRLSSRYDDSEEFKSIPIPDDLECFVIEINFIIHANPKLEVNCVCYQRFLIFTFFPIYDNIILLGDFNSEVTEQSMSEFCNIYNLKNLVKL